MLKKFLGIFISVFAVFLMSHNVSAAQRIGNYTYGVSNISGFPSNNTIVNNRLYAVSANQSDFYVANGQWTTGIYWMPGQEYHLSVSVVAEGSGLSSVVPEAINVNESHYRSTGDVITSSVSCPNSVSCKNTIIHDITLVGVLEGTEVIKTPNSNILNAHTSGTFSGNFVMSAMLFTDTDEWRSWRDGVEDSISDIADNTHDTVDILDQIYDRLDVLDSNADANAQAWDNMQNTEGLIDIGNQDGALTIVNSINSVLGQVRDIPASATCSISGALGHNFNMGDINLCQGKDYFGGIITFSATVIFLFISFIIVIRVIKKVLRLISWCRRN